MSDYPITDDQIEATLRYLKIFHPEQATREFAENWLHYWKAEYRKISVGNLENDTMEKLFRAYRKSIGQDI
jgi:hypothetical protein